jgi:putative PIG3 family NAD(P)H quinone oxidoreductase
MQAMSVSATGDLIWGARQPVALGPGQVRIRIAAAGVNRADLLQCQGLYPPPAGYSDIPGLECAGEVIEAGARVTRLAPGMAVCALLAAGGYATEVVCDARQVLPLPAGLGMEEGAALPEVFATAWSNLFGLADLREGEKVLVKAGGSGVGTAAVQLCRAFGSPVFVQVGSDDKLRRCVELGASGGVNRHTGELSALRDAGPFDVILDPVAGAGLQATIDLMNDDGRLLIIGLLGGRRAEIDVGRLLVKRLEILGSTLRSQPIPVKARIMHELFEHVWPRLERGDLRPVIDAVLPIGQVGEAHRRLAANATFGKIVLRVPG